MTARLWRRLRRWWLEQAVPDAPAPNSPELFLLAVNGGSEKIVSEWERFLSGRVIHFIRKSDLPYQYVVIQSALLDAVRQCRDQDNAERLSRLWGELSDVVTNEEWDTIDDFLRLKERLKDNLERADASAGVALARKATSHPALDVLKRIEQCARRQSDFLYLYMLRYWTDEPHPGLRHWWRRRHVFTRAVLTVWIVVWIFVGVAWLLVNVFEGTETPYGTAEGVAREIGRGVEHAVMLFMKLPLGLAVLVGLTTVVAIMSVTILRVFRRLVGDSRSRL